MNGIRDFFIGLSQRWHHLPRGTSFLMFAFQIVTLLRNDEYMICVGSVAGIAMLVWILMQPPKE